MAFYHNSLALSHSTKISLPECPSTVIEFMQSVTVSIAVPLLTTLRGGAARPPASYSVQVGFPWAPFPR